MDLPKLMTAHESRLERDKKSIMTMVFKKAPASCATRSAKDDRVIALDLDNHNQILMFENAAEKTLIDIPEMAMKNRSVVQVRYDLMDCHVCVCSPEVLLRFVDEFDYQDIREDFVKGAQPQPQPQVNPALQL